MKQEDLEARVAERVKKLGRRLTARELIELINEIPVPSEDHWKYDIDEDQHGNETDSIA